ncbi:MAG: AAA family ATPase [Leptospira sp.]|nr:AAA family ATPase [Leptospira sp.]
MNLRLKNFGHFTEKEFQVSPLTIFFGPNESGKTTILDSILSCLIHIPGTNTFGKLLNRRYQKDRSSQLDFEKKSVPVNLMLNSLVIREGQMNIDSSDKDLTKAIQDSLFDSGYDPTKLKSLALDNCNRKGNAKPGRDLKTAKEELEKSEIKFKNSELRLKEIANSFSDVPKKDAEKKLILGEIDSLEKSIQNYEEKILELKENESYAELNEIYAILLKFESLKLQRKQDESFISASYDERATRLAKENLVLTERIDDLKKQSLEKGNQRKNLLDQVSIKESASVELTRYSAFFEVWKNKLNSLRNDIPFQIQTKWNLSYIILAMFAIFSSISFSIGIAISNWEPYYYLLSVFGFAVGFYLFQKSQEKFTIRDENVFREKLSEIANTIETQSLGDLKYRNMSVDDILNEINRLEKDFLKIQLEIENLKKEVQGKDAEIKILDDRITTSQIQAEETQRQLNETWKQTETKSLDELKEKYTDIKIRNNEYNTLSTKVETIIKRFGETDLQTLKLKIKDTIVDKEKRGISKEFTSEEKSLKLKIESELADKKSKLKSLEKNLVELDLVITNAKARLETQMIPASKEWEESKKDLEKKIHLLEKRELDIRAFEKLSEVFASMEGESNHQMNSLIQSLQNRWSSLHSKDQARILQKSEIGGDIKLKEMRTDESRDFSNLSTGTREQLSYAMRIEYAYRIGTKEKIPFLLLDEPFRHMDDKRRDQAIEYTLEFLKLEEWTGFIFTFDEGLKGKLVNLAKLKDLPCQVHQLN